MAKVSCQSSLCSIPSMRQVVLVSTSSMSLSDGMELSDSESKGLTFIGGRPRRMDLAVVKKESSVDCKKKKKEKKRAQPGKLSSTFLVCFSRSWDSWSNLVSLAISLSFESIKSLFEMKRQERRKLAPPVLIAFNFSPPIPLPLVPLDWITGFLLNC